MLKNATGVTGYLQNTDAEKLLIVYFYTACVRCYEAMSEYAMAEYALSEYATS